MRLLKGGGKMTDCIFCRIASKELASTAVYEDDSVIAFKDLEPQAPIHLLIIPKKHIKSILDLKEADKELVAHIHVDVIPKLAQELCLSEKGCRIVVNMGAEGGQTVGHLHFHLLGGRFMKWPPG